MAVYLNLYVDWWHKKLVGGLTDPGYFIIPARTQGEILPLKIYMVRPNGGISFAQESIAGTALEVVVASAPGATGTIIAANYAFDQDLSDGNGFFYGNLDFTSGTLDTWLGAATEKDAYFEMRWSGSAAPVPYRTSKFTIYPRTVPVAVSTPPPGQVVLTEQVANQRFVSKWMSNGETITIPSANGAYATIIGTNDDGSTRMEVIQLT